MIREMLRLIEEGHITRLWISDFSRLSRNDSVSNYIKSIFLKNGLELHIDKYLYDFDNETDKLLYGVLSVFNEYENNLRFSKSVSGKISKIKVNGHIGGTPNYGFEVLNGRLVPHPDQSVIVQQIFQWYGLENKSIKWIQDELLRLGINSPRGNKIWNMVSLRNMLRNKIYRGEHYVEIRQLKGKSRKYCEERGKLFQHTIQLDDKIVDENTWNEVQKRHKKYMRVSRMDSNQKKEKYLLSGLIHCNGCGDPMWGKKQHSQNRYNYYCGNTHYRWRKSTNKKCKSSKSINLKLVEKMIWCSTVDVWSNSYTIKEEFKKSFLEPKLKDKKDVSLGLSQKLKSKSNLQSEIKTLEKRNKTLYSDFMTLRIKEKEYKDIVKHIESEITLRNKKLKKIDDEVKLLQKKNVWFDWLNGFEEELKTIKNWNEKDDFDKMKDFLNKVIDRIDIIWNSEDNTHQLKIKYKLNIYKDKRSKNGKWKFNISKGQSERISERFSSYKLSREIGLKELTLYNSYSTVIDLLLYNMKNSDFFVNFSFTITITTSKLTKTSHYNKKQQKIFDTIKYLKEEEGLGYRKISHRLKEMGMKSIRSNKELKYNYVFSIYKKGKIRENRINREFKDTISDFNFNLIGE
jgi:hypothetical protein